MVREKAVIEEETIIHESVIKEEMSVVGEVTISQINRSLSPLSSLASTKPTDAALNE